MGSQATPETQAGGVGGIGGISVVRCRVVVRDNVDLDRRAAEAGVARVGQGNLNGLVGFVQGIVHDGDGDVLGRDSGRKR